MAAAALVQLGNTGPGVKFLDWVLGILEGYEILWGDDLGQIKASMEAASPEVLDFLRDMLGERFGTEFR